MDFFVVNSEVNTSRTLIDCAFQTEAGAKAYIDALNGDRDKAVARCKEIIALREGETMVKFLVDEYPITFTVLTV